MKTLGLEPFIHPTARVHESALGRYTEVGAGCHVSRSRLGDYSYCVENTQIAYATIGKFANIAAHVRIYASKHPMERASLHHFTYRSSWYFEGEHLPSSSKRSRRWSGWISPRRRRNGRRRCRGPAAARGDCPGADAGSRRSSLTSPSPASTRAMPRSLWTACAYQRRGHHRHHQPAP